MVIQHPCVPLVENVRLGQDLFRLRFLSGGIASGLRPGNFVHIRVSSELDPLFRRPMSVHACDRDTFSILFRVIGKGTRLLSELREGDSVDVLGPLGNGFDLPEVDESAVMVAGGTGVPPLHFLTQRLLARDGNRHDKVIFLCGISSAKDIPLAETAEGLGVQFSLSSDDGSVGHRGFVTDLLGAHLREVVPAATRVYSCGPDQMLRAVSMLCAEHSVRCQVSLEGNMPCGIGTCLGCVVRSSGSTEEYRRICVEGPVFNSSEVKI